MRRYKITLNKVRSTEFELNARNKKEALSLVDEILFKTCILDLDFIKHKTDYEIDITKTKRIKKS